MFFLPFTLLFVVLLIFFIPLLVMLAYLGIIGFAFSNLGISSEAAFLFYLLSFMLSTVNIPVYRKEMPVPIRTTDSPFDIFLGSVPSIYKEQIIAVNVGGCILPVLLSLHLMRKVEPGSFLITFIVVTLVAYLASRAVPGVGIVMPVWISPFTSAITAAIVAPHNPAAVAFSAGVLGTLVGADILHLKDFMRSTPGILSIGGAGVFDGIFLTGIIAAFLS